MIFQILLGGCSLFSVVSDAFTFNGIHQIPMHIFLLRAMAVLKALLRVMLGLMAVPGQHWAM